MLCIKVDSVLFKGQYAVALTTLQSGSTITMADFHNGSWEPTMQVQRFIQLLRQTNLAFKISGNSARTTRIWLT